MKVKEGGISKRKSATPGENPLRYFSARGDVLTLLGREKMRFFLGLL